MPHDPRYRRKRWVHHLRHSGLPEPHIAYVLALTIDDVAEIPDVGRRGRRTRALPKFGPLHYGWDGAKVRRLHSLGYTARRIAHIFHTEPHLVRRAIRRMKANARAADWAWRSAVDPAMEPLELAAAQAVAAELVEEAPAPPPVAPNYWHDVGDLRRPLDPETEATPPIVLAPVQPTRSYRKLTNQQVDEILDLHARGWSLRDLAHGFGVHNTTIGKVVNGERQREKPPPESSEAGNRWHVQGDRRTTDPECPPALPRS